MNKLYEEFNKIFKESADRLTVVAYVDAVSDALDYITRPLALEFELGYEEMEARVGRVKAKLKERLEKVMGVDPVEPTEEAEPEQPQE